jgi:hypothetical protein
LVQGSSYLEIVALSGEEQIMDAAVHRINLKLCSKPDQTAALRAESLTITQARLKLFDMTRRKKSPGDL